MKTSIILVMLAGAACALSTQAFAYTINGMVPPGKPIVIKLQNLLKPSLMKFTFTAPSKNAGVPYALDFCVGLRANPCGLPGSHVINVPAGQTRVETFDSAIFATNVLVVEQGTKVPVPYSVQVDF